MYTEKDCEPCDGSQCLIDRVVVLRQEEKSGQVYCGRNFSGKGKAASVTDLSGWKKAGGEWAVLGVLFFRGWQIVGWGCLKKYGGSAPICTDAEKIPVPDQNL